MIAQDDLARSAPRTRSLVDVFEGMAASRSSAMATKQKRAGQWVETTWGELARRTRAVSDGLAALGVRKGDRIAILGETHTEWIIADLGIMGAAAITVPVYQSLKAHDIQYILADSGARFILCDSDVQAAKIREIRDRCPALEGIIRLDNGAPKDASERTLAEIEKLGSELAKQQEGAHAARLATLSLDEPACFLYTSGTTGNPKGVVLTHGNWVYEAEAVHRAAVLADGHLVLMFLPMAHSFAKVVEAAWFKLGFSVAFVESLDRIVDNAGEVRPTAMPAVPRIFEKAYNTVVSKGVATPGLKGKLFKWAMDGLDQWVAAKERGQEIPPPLGLRVGKKLVFPKVGKTLGERFGGRMQIFISGGAPLSPKIAWFFQNVGFVVLEGYGLTETSAATCVNRPGKVKIGTVGPALPGTELKIAPDGEILIRGGGVMKEYYNNPGATAEALEGGWFHSGDIGELDADGYLRITDRKKDIIVTAGGKNVAPQNLENDLKTNPLISQVMVHGDKRKFLSALITLNEENVRKWAADSGISLGGALNEDPRVRGEIQRAVNELNSRQASYATIKKFAIIARDFTIESGELTPTLKVKRKVATQNYAQILDGFYAE
ncbi:MAG TPA: long-chain fatty acid--CoA ligase [Anaeromyxobacteraceae bacterium]|nr:long-chain fatty acid--CoA ligase [Anaeromyxobacteraceae bacterium]